MKKAKTNYWTLVLIMGVFVGSGFLAACGKSGGGDTVLNPGVVQTCTNAGCTYPVPANSKLGFYAQTSNFYIPGYVNNGSTLQMQSGMSQVLKDAMGVCDRVAYTGGISACSNWMGGAHDLVLYSDAGSTANTMKLIIRSTPGMQLGGYGWYQYSVPDFKTAIFNLLGFPVGNYSGVFDPMVLEATIWPVNNSQGFEVRAYGPRMSYAWNKLFQLQVANGKLEDAQWNFQLYFNGQAAMSGKAVRCQSQNCGLDSSYFNTGM
jgi:hypothetical protein